MMRRRDIITLLGGGAAAWPLVARSQQAAALVVGFVSSRSLDGSARPAAAFSQGLSQTGYVVGQNVTV
jgi:putative tryptophan/tyrosine transport system substrate-binding protein